MKRLRPDLIEICQVLQNKHVVAQQGHVSKTAFTEWLFYAPDDTYPRYDNMGGAVATAGFLNMLLRNSDIVPVSDMTGLVEFGGLWKKRSRVYGVPAYWAFKMYSTADVSRAVEVRTEGETYNVEQGSNRLPNIAGMYPTWTSSPR